MLDTQALYKGANGFASPGSGLTREEYMKIAPQLKASNIAYVRTSLRYKSFPKTKTLLRKLSRVVPAPFIYAQAYQDTLIDEVNDGFLYSVPVLSSISPSEIFALINTAVKKGKSLILMMHSIVPDGGVRDPWDYEIGKFAAVCQKVAHLRSENKIETKTSMDIFNHYKNV